MIDLEARMRRWDRAPLELLARDTLFLALSREWLALKCELSHRQAPAEAATHDDGSEPS